MDKEQAIETLRANYPDACYEQLREAVDAAIEALKAQDAAGDTISRQAAIDALFELYEYQRDIDPTEAADLVRQGVYLAEKKIEQLPSAQPELIERAAYIRGFEQGKTQGRLDTLSAQPEWNNHTVACLLADLFDDTCACNYNGIDEWLPEKCEVIDSCPNPVGVACWEQFLKHRAERRTDGE